MGATEPIQGGPYPEPDDAPDGPNQMAALATWAAGRLVMRFASTTARDDAITSPVEGMVAVTGTGTSLRWWVYVSGAWRDVTIPGAWTARTPTATGLTIGNGTITARWSRVGRRIHERGSIVLGSTSSVTGTLFVALPTAAQAADQGPLGGTLLSDSSAGALQNAQALLSGTGNLVLLTAAGSYVNASAPWAWATGDAIRWAITYEAAA